VGAELEVAQGDGPRDGMRTVPRPELRDRASNRPADLPQARMGRYGYLVVGVAGRDMGHDYCDDESATMKPVFAGRS